VEPESEEIVVKDRPQQAQEDTGDEEDDMPTTQGTQRRRKRAARRSSFVSVSPPAQPSDSDDDVVITSQRTTNKRKQREDSEDDEEDDEIKTPGRRRLKRPRKMTKEEQEDLADDLDFLKPSDDESSARTPRNMQSVKKNARLNALEMLKRKRAGQTEEEENQDDVVDLLSDSENFNSEEDDGLLDEDDEEALPFTSSRQYFQETNEDAEFVEEGSEDDTLGVPAGIPLEFTRYASMKTKELFKFAVEWMVQKKINPAFKMHDPIYDLTFKKLDDEVTGLAGSKFTSAVWTPAFTIALQSRPDILFHRLDTTGDNFMRDKCDACNRTNHPCKYEVQFRGKPYHRDTLEHVDLHDDDEDDSSSCDSDSSTSSAADRPTYNAKGQTVVPETHVFYVGKFCMSNAETAHKLNHWRFHLNEWVENFLKREKYLTADAIVRRDGLSTRKRSKEANKIVDRMERDGRVKELWMEYKDAMESARSSKQGRYGGESP
jgi:hypothetical protein